MDIKENIKSGITFTADMVNELAQSIAEKNRIRLQLNHLKQLIRADSITRDQAYAELGRFFYQYLREDASPENEALCAVIDNANDRINRASLKYVELLDLQSETKVRSENAEKLGRIISEKTRETAQTAKVKGEELSKAAKEFASKEAEKVKEIAAEKAEKAKEVAAEKAEKAKEVAAEKAEKAKEIAVEKTEKAKEVAVELKEKAVDKAKDTAAEIREKTKEKLEELSEKKTADDDMADLERLIAEEEERLRLAENAAEKQPEAPAAEESPESFDF